MSRSEADPKEGLVLPQSPTALYWSASAVVACATHAPAFESPQWETERWEPLPIAFQDLNGIVYHCHTCSPTHSSEAVAEVAAVTLWDHKGAIWLDIGNEIISVEPGDDD